MTRRALVREVADSLPRATIREASSEAIDVNRARRQHQMYVSTLRALGVEVLVLPADHAHPDCCFIEDQAVVRDGVALIARSGNPTRRGEALAVAEALAPHVELHHMEEPATLDGGDVLAVGHRLFVGLSARTNQGGVDRLREVFGQLGFEVTAVSVPTDTLHLKSSCSPLGEDAIALAEGTLPSAVFANISRVILIPAAEAYAANTLAIGDHVLCAAGHPTAARALAAAGLHPLPVDVSEFRKADGALTCLSVLF
jgi:dimethylargininase